MNGTGSFAVTFEFTDMQGKRPATMSIHAEGAPYAHDSRGHGQKSTIIAYKLVEISQEVGGRPAVTHISATNATTATTATATVCRDEGRLTRSTHKPWSNPARRNNLTDPDVEFPQELPVLVVGTEHAHHHVRETLNQGEGNAQSCENYERQASPTSQPKRRPDQRRTGGDGCEIHDETGNRGRTTRDISNKDHR